MKKLLYFWKSKARVHKRVRRFYGFRVAWMRGQLVRAGKMNQAIISGSGVR